MDRSVARPATLIVAAAAIAAIGLLVWAWRPDTSPATAVRPSAASVPRTLDDERTVLSPYGVDAARQRAGGESRAADGSSLAAPAAWIVVEVVGPDDRPVAGAALERMQSRPLVDGLRQNTRFRYVTDDAGRVRLGVADDAEGARLDLFATSDASVSTVVSLEPPWPESVRLVLGPGAQLVVEVVDRRGAPVPREPLWLHPTAESWTVAAPDGGETDAKGRRRFAVPAGEWALQYRDPVQSEWGRRVFELEEGETRRESVVLGRAPTAVSGRVVDEEGEPLGGVGLTLVVHGRPSLGARSEPRTGHFEFHAAAFGAARLESNTDLWGDQFEPDTLDVAFGATGIEVRRVRRLPHRDVAFEFVAADTGERVDEVVVLGHRAPPDVADYSIRTVYKGLYRSSCKLHESLKFDFVAIGFRRHRELALGLVARADEDGVARVELERGFAGEVRVVDGVTAVSVIGARLLDADGTVGVTDWTGLALVERASWPGELRVEADGYENGFWKPDEWIWDLDTPEVVLAPLER